MFDLGMQELIIIFVVALIVFGPQKLPELARTLGKGMRELKRAMHGIKNTFEEADIRQTNGSKEADFALSPVSDNDLEQYTGKEKSSQAHDKEEVTPETSPDFQSSHSSENNENKREEKHDIRTESPIKIEDDKRTGGK